MELFSGIPLQIVGERNAIDFYVYFVFFNFTEYFYKF